MATTAEVYRTFTGKDPKRIYQVKVPKGTRAPRNFAELGNLVKLEGFRAYLGEVEIKWSRGKAKLLATSGGTLYIWCPDGGLLALSYVESLEYENNSISRSSSFEHEFSAPRPRLQLVYRSRGKLARLIGGRYKINSRGILD